MSYLCLEICSAIKTLVLVNDSNFVELVVNPKIHRLIFLSKHNLQALLNFLCCNTVIHYIIFEVVRSLVGPLKTVT